MSAPTALSRVSSTATTESSQTPAINRSQSVHDQSKEDGKEESDLLSATNNKQQETPTSNESNNNSSNTTHNHHNNSVIRSSSNSHSQPTTTSYPNSSSPTSPIRSSSPPAAVTPILLSSPPPRPAPIVADPEPFPHPTIRRSHLRRVNIRITDTVVEQKTVIHSGSGRVYEIGATLKKAIFGHVIHSILIAPSETNPEEFRRTNQQMAIKVYSKRLLRQLQGRTQENPLMEITALQYIGNDHPNLMGQIECCTDEENIYSVMRYCQGGELFDFIDENGPLTNSQAKRMFKQLLAGLQRLQELGIGHRDMSLENILYDQNEIYVIIDFGMCLRLKPHPSLPGQWCSINRQQICGKKNYIAPEVLREDPIFNPMVADIWAAGIILFIVLTGVPPIDKATHADIRYSMICEGRLQEMVNNWNIDMEPQVVDLIQRLLRSDPMERLTIPEILEHAWLQDA